MWECTNLAAAIGAAFGGGSAVDRWHLDVCRKFQAGACYFDRNCGHFHPGMVPEHARPSSAERARHKLSLRDRDERKRARHDDRRHDRDSSAARILCRYAQDHIEPAPGAAVSLAKPSRAVGLAHPQAPRDRPSSSSASAGPASQQRTTIGGGRRACHQGRRGRGGPEGWFQFGISIPTLNLAAIQAGYSPGAAAAQPLDREEQRAGKAIITFLRDWQLIRQSKIAFTPEGFVDACDLQDWSAQQGHVHGTLFRCILISRSRGREHGRFELVNNTATDTFWVRASSVGTSHTDGGHGGVVADSSDESAAYPESWLQGESSEGTAAEGDDLEGRVKDEDLASTQPFSEPLEGHVKDEDLDGYEDHAEIGVL